MLTHLLCMLTLSEIRNIISCVRNNKSKIEEYAQYCLGNKGNLHYIPSLVIHFKIIIWIQLLLYKR